MQPNISDYSPLHEIILQCLYIVFLFQLCYDYDPALFMFLVGPVFKKFQSITVGNKEMIKMLVSAVHPDEVIPFSV